MEIRLGETTVRGRRIALYWLLVILVVVLDQATKAVALEILGHGSLAFIPGIVDLVLVHNTGAAFSIGEGASTVFVIVAMVIFVASLVFVSNTDDLPFSLVASIALVAGGGMGNLVDRVVEGSVTDFLSFAFVRFPVFNVADICVTLGVVASLIFYWRWETQRSLVAADANSQGNV